MGFESVYNAVTEILNRIWKVIFEENEFFLSNSVGRLNGIVISIGSEPSLSCHLTSLANLCSFFLACLALHMQLPSANAGQKYCWGGWDPLSSTLAVVGGCPSFRAEMTTYFLSRELIH